MDPHRLPAPRKLGFEWLGESRDEPEAPTDLGIEWRWRMKKGAWRAGS